MIKYKLEKALKRLEVYILTENLSGVQIKNSIIKLLKSKGFSKSPRLGYIDGSFDITYNGMQVDISFYNFLNNPKKSNKVF